MMKLIEVIYHNSFSVSSSLRVHYDRVLVVAKAYQMKLVLSLLSLFLNSLSWFLFMY